ncbi:hypothetical protein [Halomonas heilongjiangensis]|uniref:hypothetical protein n=1 Tax=Halomonas heilongjiangensis TaxID=1387883 RepID=UPI0011AED811|nr:hypothetical protein [Halomonas heilongjiangensis]
MDRNMSRFLYDGRKSQRIAAFTVYATTVLGVLGYAEGTLSVPIWLIAGPSTLVAVWYIASNLIHAAGWLSNRTKRRN